MKELIVLFISILGLQTAATAKACYVCYKPSTTVLATINTVDFLYTCPGHLTDANFATPLGESSGGLGAEGAKKLSVSPEEIAKVKEEWEERQRIKLEKEKAKGKEKDEKGTGDKDKDASKKVSLIPPTTPPVSAATHESYSLHRDYFAMRLSEHRKRRQAARAKELAPRLPGAPHGALTGTF